MLEAVYGAHDIMSPMLLLLLLLLLLNTTPAVGDAVGLAVDGTAVGTADGA